MIKLMRNKTLKVVVQRITIITLALAAGIFWGFLGWIHFREGNYDITIVSAVLAAGCWTLAWMIMGEE